MRDVVALGTRLTHLASYARFLNCLQLSVPRNLIQIHNWPFCMTRSSSELNKNRSPGNTFCCVRLENRNVKRWVFPKNGQKTRILGPEQLAQNQVLISDFKQQKLEKEAQKNWDLFYKRNSTNFFKDRHWTTREFEELKVCHQFEDQKLTILEAGCGVGNCLFPLLEDLNMFAYACDFSPRAVEYVKQNPLYDAKRCKVFLCDLTKDDLVENVPLESVDVVMLIFVLSAIHPEKMHFVLNNIYKVLKPGKYVLFRDYGLHDHAMLRFKSACKLGENFYVRQDGTRSYFFSDEFLAELFLSVGYEEIINEYVFRETLNKKENICVPRVFLQSKFRKPLK